MALSTTLALSVGPAIAKSILKIWLKDADLLQNVSESLIDLVGQKTKDVFTRKKAERQFQDIGDRVAQGLEPLFDSEASIPENGKAAVAIAVATTLEKTTIDARFLIDRKLDPVELARHLIVGSKSFTVGLSSSEVALFERIIGESSRYIVDMASQLPAFSETSFAELIQKGDQLVETAGRILEEVRRIREASIEENAELTAAAFETEYRLAVGRKLDELELFGVDIASAANRRHRLSVAYVTLSVRGSSIEDKQLALDGNDADSEDAEDLVAIDAILRTSSRILVRGQAGSGKTTLLQWVAVKAASRSFADELSSWNSCVPFFIRLRDCVDKGLPKPEELPRFIAPLIADRMPKGWVHQRLETGQAVLLVDGVDEMREVQRADVRKWLKDLCETFPRVRILVSSRPSAIDEGWMDAESFQDAELQPMTLADTLTFIDHWHSAVSEQLTDKSELEQLAVMCEHLKKVVRTTQPIRNLTTNPLLAAMLCALNRDRRQNLPADRIELYEACCHMLAERRDKERRVSLQDYPSLSYRQKRSLLEDLAYWFMVNGWSVVTLERAEHRLANRLGNMSGLPQGLSGEDVMRLFVDRTGLVREPRPEHVDFTHRTFQEFLAAKAALDEGNLGALIRTAHEDQWRELIVLAAGLASQKIREELISGLLARGDADPKIRHQLHLLAVSCLETSVALEPSVLQEVESRLKKLVPPKNRSDEIRGLASAGDLAVRYLQHSRKLLATQAAACVRALAQIGTDSALEALIAYATDDRQTIINALIKAWDSFDREEFAKRVLSKRKRLAVNHIDSFAAFEHLVELEYLNIWSPYTSDWSPVSRLPKLRTLAIGAWWGGQLDVLRNLATLEEIRFYYGHGHIKDFSFLAELPNLKAIIFHGPPPNGSIPEQLKDKVKIMP